MTNITKYRIKRACTWLAMAFEIMPLVLALWFIMHGMLSFLWIAGFVVMWGLITDGCTNIRNYKKILIMDREQYRDNIYT